MNALVIDDSPTMRRVVSGVLLNEFADIKILESADGRDAWDTLKLEKVDIVLSDWIMPIMSGIDLVRNIRADERLSDMPFIMISTKGMKMDIIQAIRAGVNDYCVKPVVPAVLVNKIKNVLNIN